jgi:endo-1,4-beta-xylanase
MNPQRLLKYFLAACGGAAALCASPEPFKTDAAMIRIWPGIAPGSEGKENTPERWLEGGTPDAFHRVTDIHQPSLTIYLPAKDKATGAAVIIAPGGGHRYLVVDLEGELVAKKLNDMGVAAFVLRSRLARAEGSTYRVEVESLADVQQAIRVVRSRAADWGVNPARVGVMGFSAGGQLAALAENKFDAATRPDFAVLGYPAYIGAKTEVAKDAPPTFMFVDDDDGFATGAGEYFLALRAAKISTEFHVFRRGGHGVGATGRAPGFEKLGVAKWPELLGIWLGDLGLLQ